MTPLDSGWGETKARLLNTAYELPQPTAALLASTYGSKNCADGAQILTLDGFNWRYVAASAATDTTQTLVLTPNDSPAAGRWLRQAGAVDIKVAVDFNTADAAVLFTVPVGFKLRVTRACWEVTTPFSGGASSAIGLSSSNAAYTTKGDLLGGAAGDLAAALTAGYRGAIGTKLASGGLVVLIAGDTVRFDRVASAYTAGAGFIHVTCEVLA